VIDTKPVKAPKPKPIIRYYNVRSGDTFSKIAQHHNLTQQQLKRLNPGLNENRLSVGQRIRVK
jgi:LysM repeat protein